MANNTQSQFEQAKKQAQDAVAAAKKAKGIADAKNTAKERADNLSRDIDNDRSNAGDIFQQNDGARAALAQARKNYTTYVQATTGPNHPGHPTPSELTQIAIYDNAVSAQELVVDKLDKEYAQLLNDIKTKTQQMNDQNAIAKSPDGKLPPAVKVHTSSGSSTSSITSNNSNNKKTILTPPKDPPYKYNVHMASDSYFNPFGLQAKELQANGFFVDPGNYDDARKAWKGRGGRGTIQMDQKFSASQYVAAAYASASKDNPPVDNTLYGFKFLYNPTTIGMAWGVQQETVPSFEASGQDVVNPIASGLVTSTLSVTLMLNRIEDMKYLGPKGLKPLQASSGLSLLDYAQEELDIASILTAQVTNKLDKTQPANSTNPYPDGTSNDDLIGIYERGTMYDLEYLFRTVQGPSGKFVSTLNDVPAFQTADKGWLRPTIVEVHLGNTLRYRARITELSVNHAVFDSRMVPLLSTVTITLARFNDFANYDYSKK